jgi:NodT family efflux transporter outer membrane factor (OMF) lipoprotein
MRTLPCLSLTLLTMAITLLGGCAVGPDFKSPPAQAPADWSSLRAGDASLHEAVPQGSTATPSAEWWKRFGDPVLDGLEADAAAANPDLQTAALRFAESRAQRQTTAAQRGPQVDMTASVQRQRPSENGATSRTIDVLAPADRRDALVKLLSQPYNIYQGGFDASWEPDFWGRVRRSVEAADAQVLASGALFDGVRLDVAADVARCYFELRGTQRQIALTRADLDAAQDHFTLMKARADGGMASDLDTTQQQALLADLRARLPALLAQEANSYDQLSVLIGQTPGSLQGRLAPPAADADSKPVLPSLVLGIPSDVVRRRPDIRQAEAQLHEATANVGVAIADLYPRITLGGSFAFESLQSGDFGDWGSRHWSVGPSLDLPIFDMGRRRSVVTLRKLQQQEAAVAWQKSVLQAWSNIDTALNAYSAERQRNAQLAERERLSRDAYSLADVRYRNGRTTFIDALDAQRTLLAAQRDRADSDAQLAIRLVAIYKAIGGGA